MSYEAGEVRHANGEEAASIARRTDRERKTMADWARTERREPIMFAVIAVTVVTLAGVFLPVSRDAWFFRVFVGAMAVGAAAIGVLGFRAAARRANAKVEEISKKGERRAAAVVDHKFTAKRLVTATDANGDGQTWLLFELEEVGWLAFDEEQFLHLNSSLVWKRSNRVTLDGDGIALHVAGDGPDLPVHRRELTPPDFAEKPDTLYWSPPETVERIPALIEHDPTVGTPEADSG